MHADDVGRACIDEIPVIDAFADVFEIEFIDFYTY